MKNLSAYGTEDKPIKKQRDKKAVPYVLVAVSFLENRMQCGKEGISL